MHRGWIPDPNTGASDRPTCRVQLNQNSPAILFFSRTSQVSAGIVKRAERTGRRANRTGPRARTAFRHRWAAAMAAPQIRATALLLHAANQSTCLLPPQRRTSGMEACWRGYCAAGLRAGTHPGRPARSHSGRRLPPQGPHPVSERAPASHARAPMWSLRTPLRRVSRGGRGAPKRSSETPHPLPTPQAARWVLLPE